MMVLRQLGMRASGAYLFRVTKIVGKDEGRTGRPRSFKIADTALLTEN